MRWLLLILTFIFIFIGIEIYRNTELIESSYTVQSLEDKIERIEKENALLKKEILSGLSLKKLETYARKELNLEEPKEVRYIRGRAFQEERKVSSFNIWNWIKELIDSLREFVLDGLESVFSSDRVSAS